MNAETTKVQRAFRRAGFYPEHWGGGSYVFRRDLADGTCEIVTDLDGTDLPVRWSETVVIGTYRDDAGELEEVEEPYEWGTARDYLARLI